MVMTYDLIKKRNRFLVSLVELTHSFFDRFKFINKIIFGGKDFFHVLNEKLTILFGDHVSTLLRKMKIVNWLLCHFVTLLKIDIKKNRLK